MPTDIGTILLCRPRMCEAAVLGFRSRCEERGVMRSRLNLVVGRSVGWLVGRLVSLRCVRCPFVGSCWWIGVTSHRLRLTRAS